MEDERRFWDELTDEERTELYQQELAWLAENGCTVERLGLEGTLRTLWTLEWAKWRKVNGEWYRSVGRFKMGTHQPKQFSAR